MAIKRKELKIRPRIKKDDLIKRKDLLTVLDQVRPALGNAFMLSQSDNFIFSDDKICTYNNELSVSVPFPIRLKCIVQADKFYDLIKEADCELLTITKEGNSLVTKGGSFKASFVLEEENIIEAMIDLLDLENLPWKKLPSNFLDGIRLCSFSISKDVTDGWMFGLVVNGDSVYSCDNLRVSWFVMNGKVKGQFIISASSVNELLKYEVNQIAVTDTWIHFKSNDGVIFSCRVMLEEPDDIKGFFGTNRPFIKITLPSGLKGVLKRTLILCHGDKDEDKEVDLVMEKNKIICNAERPGYGWISESIKFDGISDSIKMKINPMFLLQVLDKTDYIIYSKKGNKIEFESGDFKHVISLIPEG